MRCSGVVAALLLFGCETSSGVAPMPSGTATAGPSAATTASAGSSARPGHPHAGRYAGSFEAAKAEVPLDEGVSYPTWTDEDGKAVSGTGKLELTVDDAGAVTGKANGALGALTIAGRVEGDVLSATLRPEDPNAADAMTGTLVGRLDPAGMKGQLRASSRDGNVARKATATLKKSTP
jgi:hypothetical protein